MKSYEIEFPLKHPKYVIEDADFQKKMNRLMGTGHPMVQFYRKVERAFLIMKYEGVKALLKKISK